MGGCYSVAPEHGPRIAAVGGGTGLSTLLRGLKLYTKNLTAIVTVADDGGGSGRLRQDLGMPPPGDIRSCLEALANAEPLMAQLMHYRFPEGTLAGQSFGNLFLAALNGIMPSFDRAVESMSQVLAITGRVLPVTTADVQLEATFENGASVVGESHIFRCKKEQDCRIRRVRLIPEHPRALPAAVEALGVEIISRPVATVENGLVRHNPGHLAWELVQLHNQRNIRLVCRDSHRTTCNRVET